MSADATASTPASAVRTSRLMTDSTTQRLSRESGADSTICTSSPTWQPISSWALTRLLALFRPERLPEVIQRPADLFDGERALDWIRRGRAAEVADRYEMALSYQA